MALKWAVFENTVTNSDILWWHLPSRKIPTHAMFEHSLMVGSPILQKPMNFLQQRLRGIDTSPIHNSCSLFALFILEDLLPEPCSICREHSPGKAVMTICGHAFHYACLRPVLFGTPNIGAVCPDCRHGLYSGGTYGVPIPPLLPAGAMPEALVEVNAPVLVQLANNRYFVKNVGAMGTLGESREHDVFPILLQQHSLPTIWKAGLHSLQFYYGRFPFEFYFRNGHTKILLLPGLVDDLLSFWAHRDKTYENYQVSVLRCRELLRRVDSDADFLRFNMQYGPIVSLYRSQGTVDLALLANPYDGMFWFKKFMFVFLLTRFIFWFELRVVRGTVKGYVVRKLVELAKYILNRLNGQLVPIA